MAHRWAAILRPTGGGTLQWVNLLWGTADFVADRTAWLEF